MQLALNKLIPQNFKCFTEVDVSSEPELNCASETDCSSSGYFLLLLWTCADFRECGSLGECAASPWEEKMDWEAFSTSGFCEMDVMYGIAGIGDGLMGAGFSLVNNLEEDVITWQVVWKFQDFRDMAVDSAKGAILLSPGSGEILDPVHEWHAFFFPQKFRSKHNMDV